MVETNAPMAKVGVTDGFPVAFLVVHAFAVVPDSSGGVSPEEPERDKGEDDGVTHRSPHAIARMAMALRMIPTFWNVSVIG
jgi:hypothetical protein